MERVGVVIEGLNPMEEALFEVEKVSNGGMYPGIHEICAPAINSVGAEAGAEACGFTVFNAGLFLGAERLGSRRFGFSSVKPSLSFQMIMEVFQYSVNL
jgi:hypothetical protein